MKMKLEWKGTLLGAMAGLVTLVTVSAIFAALISKEILGIEYLNVGSAVALILSGIVCGISGGRGEDRWLKGAAAVLGLLLLLLGINLLGFGGSLKGVAPCGMLVVASASGTCLVMGGRKGGKRRNYQIKKYRTG